MAHMQKTNMKYDVFFNNTPIALSRMGIGSLKRNLEIGFFFTGG